MHWLTAPPTEGLSDAVHHSISEDNAGIAAFAKQAEQDWELCLLQRAKELVPGGTIVIANFTLDDNGFCLGNVERNGGASANMYIQTAPFVSLAARLSESIHKLKIGVTS